MIPAGIDLEQFDKYKPTGKALAHKLLSNFMHVVACAGQCMFGGFAMPAQMLADNINAATGYDLTVDEITGDLGSRIAAIRTAFNVREGVMPMDVKLPQRILGMPPLEAGPLKGVKVDVDTQVREYLELMGWDTKTGVPTEETLRKLGLDFVIDDMLKS